MTAKPIKKQKLRNSEYYSFQDVQDKLYADSIDKCTFTKLMQFVVCEENIKLAFRNIKKNKGCRTAGVDGKTIEHLKHWKEDKLIDYVKRRLAYYEAQPVRRVEIPKGNGKTRPLGIPTIMDRLIQQCFLQVLEPICEAKFYGRSNGFRPERSCEHAIAQAYKYMQVSNLHFVVDIDIKGFFENVSHGKLLKQMWTIGIRDKKLLSIISAILKSEVAGIGFPEKGTPQGGIISPLLSNIVLNELDWWVASQWEDIPTKFPFHEMAIRNGKTHSPRGNKFPSIRKTKLKECYIVRYADDFKIFCRTRNDADRIFHATKDWLKHRLDLEISAEKSKVVNLKKQYSEFLGFRMKVMSKGKKTNGDTKYVVKSHISQKAESNINKRIKQLIVDIEHPQNIDEGFKAVNRYNAYVIGVHNYYNIATCVSLDFHKLAFPIKKSLKARLRDGFSKTGSKITPYIRDRYGDSQELRYVYNHALIPIAYVQHKNPMYKPNDINRYTPKGRELIHKKLACVNTAILEYLMRNPVEGQSIEFNDNRLSLYCAQQGKCAISGATLEIGNIHCHHKKLRSMGGTDEYANLILVLENVHRLIHATCDETIRKYIQSLSLNPQQIKKLNKLRSLAGLEIING